jgi:hypothetical protein
MMRKAEFAKVRNFDKFTTKYQNEGVNLGVSKWGKRSDWGIASPVTSPASEPSSGPPLAPRPIVFPFLQREMILPQLVMCWAPWEGNFWA